MDQEMFRIFGAGILLTRIVGALLTETHFVSEMFVEKKCLGIL